MFKIISTGQSLLLSALGPLFYAKKFVLVGDPEQLPPVVKSHVARDMGMGQSLFSHLGTIHILRKHFYDTKLNFSLKQKKFFFNITFKESTETYLLELTPYK